METNISDAEPEITMQRSYRTGDRGRELFINTNKEFASLLSNELHQTETTEFEEVHEAKITAQHSYTTGLHILVQVEPGTGDHPLSRDSVATATSATSASATPAVTATAAANTTARIAATLPSDARRVHCDSEVLSSHSRANSVRYATPAPRKQTGEASLASSSLSLSTAPPAASNGGPQLYSPGAPVPVPDNGSSSSAVVKKNATAENGSATAHGGQRTASVRKSRTLQPPPPTPRQPLVVQAASVSFERLDAHAKAVSRQTMSTKTELLQLLFNPQVVRSDLDKVRCVTKLYCTVRVKLYYSIINLN